MRNKNGQALWEFTALLAVILVGVIWFMSSQKTTSNQFESGSQQVSPTAESHPWFSLVNFTWSGTKGNQKTPALLPGDCFKVIDSKGTAVQSPCAGEKVLPTVVAPLVQEVDTPPTLAQTFGVSEKTIASIGHLNWWEKICASVVIILVVMGIGGLLDALGGFHFLFCRRYIMPFLLGLGISTISFIFNPVWYSWLVGIAVLPMMGTLTLKYMSGSNFGRAEWLLLQAVTGGLFLTLISLFFHTHFLAWYLYIFYGIGAGVGGYNYKDINQFKGDWWTGSTCLCSLVLYVYLSLQFKL